MVIVGILLVFTIEAIGRPLILEILDLISFLLAGILSFSYYNLPARWIEKQFSLPHGLSLVFGFMLIWFLSETIFYYLVRLVTPKLLKIYIPGSKFLSVIPAFLRSLVFVSIALVMLATFPIQPMVKKAVLDSKIGSQIVKRVSALEKPVKQVFGGVANDSLTFFTIEPKTDERVNLGFQTDKVSVDIVSENIMIDLLNKERVNRGLKSLQAEEKLTDVARSHSTDMFKRGYFSHYSPQNQTVANRVLNAGVDFLVVGENLAYAPTVELAFQGLMNSPGHRANMLSADFNKVGIGAIDGGIYGKMFTQVFTN